MPARQTNGTVTYGKTVWSWHPLLVSSRRRFAKLNRAMRAANSPAMEARRIRLQGEHGISRKTIAQGRPDAPADTCMLVCVFLALIAHETAGASQHPAFPAPLCPGNLSECANGRLRTNRPLLELSPLRPKATEPVSERGTAPVSSSTRTVARASSPDRARKGVDDGTK
jgi:hypothetical protein